MGFFQCAVVGLVAHAVVAHFKAPDRLLLHIKPDLGRMRVLAHVGQRLLHDVQHLDLHVGRQRQAVAGDG